MNKSESISNLAKALCKAQNEMGGAVKDATNPFFKSKYADLSSVIKAIKEPFYNNGLSYSQFPVTSAGGQGIGVTTILMHSSGEWLESEFCLPLAKLDPQAGGAAITYARRYSIMSAAGIPSEDCDSEAAMMRGKPVDNEQQDKEDACAQMVEKHIDSLNFIRLRLSSGHDHDIAYAKEAFGEINEEDQRKLWVAPSKVSTAFFTTEERRLLKGA
tara:strand:+ start:2088 stop:2732 length:645 start_codon:yes stop_codon:yes gene_type:complete